MAARRWLKKNLVSQKKKQAKKVCKERRRDAADGQERSQKEKHAEEQKDTERTEARAVSEKKTTESVAEVAVAAALAEEEEHMAQGGRKHMPQGGRKGKGMAKGGLVCLRNKHTCYASHTREHIYACHTLLSLVDTGQSRRSSRAFNLGSGKVAS